jgi:hypothetical protein
MLEPWASRIHERRGDVSPVERSGSRSRFLKADDPRLALVADGPISLDVD